MVDVNITVRSTESFDDQPFLLWDTIRDPDTGLYDWAICPIGDTVEPQNNGGLQARVPLDTAIRLQLGTKRRAEPGDTLPDGNDPKGWWGDSVQLEDDKGPIGSRLWLLSRATLTEQTARDAVTYAYEALKPITAQGVIVRFDVTASFNAVQGWLVLDIKGYSRDGDQAYSQQFAPIWALEAAAANRRGVSLI